MCLENCSKEQPRLDFFLKPSASSWSPDWETITAKGRFGRRGGAVNSYRAQRPPPPPRSIHIASARSPIDITLGNPLPTNRRATVCMTDSFKATNMLSTRLFFLTLTLVSGPKGKEMCLVAEGYAEITDHGRKLLCNPTKTELEKATKPPSKPDNAPGHS